MKMQDLLKLLKTETTTPRTRTKKVYSTDFVHPRNSGSGPGLGPEN